MMQLDAQIKVIRPGDREIGDRETRRLGDVKRDGETRDHISKKETKIEFDPNRKRISRRKREDLRKKGNRAKKTGKRAQ